MLVSIHFVLIFLFSSPWRFQHALNLSAAKFYVPACLLTNFNFIKLSILCSTVQPGTQQYFHLAHSFTFLYAFTARCILFWNSTRRVFFSRGASIGKGASGILLEVSIFFLRKFVFLFAIVTDRQPCVSLI